MKTTDHFTKLWAKASQKAGTYTNNMSPTPSYNHMEKADFLYFKVEAPSGINLVMFRDSSMTFSAKIRKKIKVAFLSNKPFLYSSK